MSVALAGAELAPLEKSNEPTVLRQRLPESFENFPLLRLLSGDVLFAGRPFLTAILEFDCDYLVQIKGNQPDARDAVQQCLGQAHERPPAAETIEKKGAVSIAAGSGSTWTTPLTCASVWTSPARKLRCVLIGT